MATGKKAFLLYTDIVHTFDHLTDDQIGKYMRYIVDYVNDREPDDLPGLLQALVEQTKQQLNRDLEKWKKQHQQRIEAGRRSAEKRKQNSTIANDRSTTVQRKTTKINDRSVSSTVNESDNVTDSVIVNVTDNVNEIEKKIPKKDLDEIKISPSSSVLIPLKEKSKQNVSHQAPKKSNRTNRNDWAADLIYPFDDMEFMHTWELWIEYRKEIKKPYKGIRSEQSALKQIGKMFEHSLDAIKAIETSMGNTWQGIFPNKTENKTNGSQTIDEFQESVNRILNE